MAYTFEQKHTIEMALALVDKLGPIAEGKLSREEMYILRPAIDGVVESIRNYFPSIEQIKQESTRKTIGELIGEIGPMPEDTKCEPFALFVMTIIGSFSFAMLSATTEEQGVQATFLMICMVAESFIMDEAGLIKFSDVEPVTAALKSIENCMKPDQCEAACLITGKTSDLLPHSFRNADGAIIGFMFVNKDVPQEDIQRVAVTYGMDK